MNRVKRILTPNPHFLLAGDWSGVVECRSMRGLVVGNNLETATAIRQELEADGINTTLHRPIHPQLSALNPQLLTDCDVVVFLCDGRARPLRTAPLTPPSPAGGEGNKASRRVVAPPPPKEGETSPKAGTFPLLDGRG